MEHTAINLLDKFELFQDQWQPKVIAEMNDYQLRLVRLEGDFIWHDHQDTDELFLVLQGQLRIDFEQGYVDLSAGELYVVPRGVRHKPFAQSEAKVLLIEPSGVVNTGSEGGERTAQLDVWI